MPYPKQLINEGETVALDLTPHWWYFSRHILTGIPLFFAFIGILALDSGNVKTALLYIWAALAIVWAIWLGLKYLAWRFTHFVVTSDRVIWRTGVLSKHGVEIPLERINNINFHQGPWERMIGAGDLEIESAGEQGKSEFDNVRHPDGVQQEIYRQTEAYDKKKASWSQAPAQPAQPSASIPEQIDQLAALRDRGVISPEEFEQKKSDLLGRM
jgi:uncharacterized membrane protein YdbT with pleckstrin-like domain